MNLAFLFLLISILWIIYGTTRLKLHPFLVLLIASLFLALSTGISPDNIPKIIGKGFGKTVESIGLLILFGTIIGVILERSNATHTLAQTILIRLAKLPLPYAVSCIGYLVSIPVFCDSAFVILSSLNKRLSAQTKTPLVALTIALSTGLFAPHVLVPPTPGPLAAAANLKLENLFLLVVFGGILAFLLVLMGAVYAHHLSQKKPNHYISPPRIVEKDVNSPSFGKALAPILLPILLMAIGAFLKFLSFPAQLLVLKSFLLALCSPTISLGMGMLVAFRLLSKQSSISLNQCIQKGIEVAAPILIITGMGGTLGLIIQQLPITEFAQNHLSQPQWGLVIPFLIAAVLKTAQGSSTVAIITTSSIVFPLLVPMGLDTEMGKVWVILAIGTGAMTISHANDSYFWIVSQLGEMDVKTAYRHHSFGTFLQGVLGLVLILSGHAISKLILG